MQVKDIRSLLGGGLMILFGLSFALYAIAEYPLGTVARMKPGMFPAILGFLIAGMGALIGLVAIFQPGHPDDESAEGAPSFLVMASVLSGIVGIGLTIGRFGLVPAIFVLTLVGMLADRSLSLVGKIILASALSALIVGIFTYGLGLTTPLVRWPS